MDKQRDDVKVAQRACVQYEKQDGTYQITLSCVSIDYIAEVPTWIVGLDEHGSEWRVQWVRVVMLRTLS